MNILFNVHYDVDAEDLQGKNVLVFLHPPAPTPNLTAHAWQVLTGTAGSTVSFQKDDVVSVSVGETDTEDSVSSERVIVQPGQLFLAEAPQGGAPVLQLAPPSLAQDKLTPYQYGVINQTNPFKQLDCTWYLTGAPVLTMPALDANMTSAFNLPQSLYFIVAEPPQAGEGMAQGFSDTTAYVPPITARVVNVTLTRVDGFWTFAFEATDKTS